MSFLQSYPRALEVFYRITLRILQLFRPLLTTGGFVEQLLIWVEKHSKGAIFDCRMCGQCTLHSTGMTCPMTCPKELRNGPCGGVRPNGHCEIIPEMPCIWVQAWDRSHQMPIYGQDILTIMPPLNRQLAGSSAWINDFTGIADTPPAGWL